MADNTTKPTTLRTQLDNDNPTRTRWVQVVSVLRNRLRDFSELNRLVDGQESSDRQLAQAVAMSISEYNSFPPVLSPVSIETFPDLSLLVDLATARVLESVAHLQIRNNLSYTDGEVSVSATDKGPLLLRTAESIRSVAYSRMSRLKVALNVSAALNQTYVASEYAYLDNFFDED